MICEDCSDKFDEAIAKFSIAYADQSERDHPSRDCSGQDHPRPNANRNRGCCGVAARLPKKPGTQKLTPSSSANAIVVVQATAASARHALAARDGICDRAADPR
jgi:hypothetical protein